MLNELNNIPEGLLEAKSEDLLKLLGGPTLIHLEGKNPTPLFVSTLLHGNETTGFYAMQKILQSFKNTKPPRSLSLFIGNVEAAEINQRRLDNQPDYNRIWPGTNLSDSPETDMVKNVTHIMRKRKPFASIDIHNNTGHNPHYGCVNILNPHGLQLASLFSNTTVYFTNPKGVQSSAFSDFCPAIVLECGQAGAADGITHSVDYVNQILQLETIPVGNPETTNLFHTVARVSIPTQFSFGTDEDKSIQLLEDLESHNFHELKKGSLFALVNDRSNAILNVINESTENVTDEFFTFVDKQILLKCDVILSMYTTNNKAIKQDCLCYFMEKIHLVA